MALGRVLVEKFSPDVLDWLRPQVELAVVDPWAEQDEWNREAPNVDAVISRKGRIGREAMEASRGRLKIIARCGVGVDPSRVDLDAAKEMRVWVTNIPGVNSVSVAELVFGHMLNLARHIQDAHSAVKAGRWSDYVLYVGTELAGKTIGIVGFGNIGTRVAIRARAFEMNFLVVDPYIPESHVTALGGRLVALPELLTESDYVTFHTPLTGETRGMVGANELEPTAGRIPGPCLPAESAGRCAYGFSRMAVPLQPRLRGRGFARTALPTLRRSQVKVKGPDVHPAPSAAP